MLQHEPKIELIYKMILLTTDDYLMGITNRGNTQNYYNKLMLHDMVNQVHTELIQTYCLK